MQPPRDGKAGTLRTPGARHNRDVPLHVHLEKCGSRPELRGFAQLRPRAKSLHLRGVVLLLLLYRLEQSICFCITSCLVVGVADFLLLGGLHPGKESVTRRQPGLDLEPG